MPELKWILLAAVLLGTLAVQFFCEEVLPMLRRRK